MSATTQADPFTAAEMADIRRFCGFPAYAAYGYVLTPEMATLDTQLGGMSAAEQAVVRTIYLPSLYTLETAIPAAGANLSTSQAAVWTHNPNEVADREALFDNWRRKLCHFIGVSPGRGLRGSAQVVRT